MSAQVYRLLCRVTSVTPSHLSARPFTDDVDVNASVAVNVNGTLSAVGVVLEVSRCLVGDLDALEEPVPPYVSAWSNGSLVSLANLAIDAEAGVVANGCAVKAAELRTLGVRFDSVKSALPLVHTLAPLLLGSEWVLGLLVDAARNEINRNANAFLPFDSIAC